MMDIPVFTQVSYLYGMGIMNSLSISDLECFGTGNQPGSEEEFRIQDRIYMKRCWCFEHIQKEDSEEDLQPLLCSSAATVIMGYI